MSWEKSTRAIFDLVNVTVCISMYPPGGVLPYRLGGDLPLGSRKSYPLLDQIANFVTLYQTKNARQLFLISVFCEQSC